MINNLLSNALKFTPKGGKIKVRVRQSPKEAILQVSDRGIVIPADKQKQIFHEFSKGKRAGLHGEKCSGLGLSIVRKIVKLHQGEIKVESKEGKGITFTIELKY